MNGNILISPNVDVRLALIINVKLSDKIQLLRHLKFGCNFWG